MSLRYFDGFDHYGAATANMVVFAGGWTQVDGVASLSTAKARTGARGLASSNTTGMARRWLGAALTAAGVGLALLLDALPSSGTAVTPIGFADATDTAQLAIAIDTAGKLFVARGDASGTQLGIAARAITPGVWNHLEVRAVFDSTAGAVEVRLNGVSVINLINVDTTATANQEASYVRHRNRATPGCTWAIDDVFAWDLSGTANNDFQGDVRVATLFPAGNTAQADFTANTGAAYAAIDEADPDDDTTYVLRAAAGTSDYGLQTLSGDVSAIRGAAVVTRARKTDAAAGSLLATLRSGGVDAAATAVALTTSYAPAFQRVAYDPVTAAPWVPAALNAALIRIQRTA